MSYPFSTPAVRFSGNGSQNESHTQPQRSPPVAMSKPSAIPMAIPNAREAAPPPLPPPRIIQGLDRGQDAGWQWANARYRDGSASPGLASVKPGSSLLGNSLPKKAGKDEERSYRDIDLSRRSSNSMGHPIDSDVRSITSHEGSDDESRTGRPSLANFRLHSENELGHRAMHNSAQSYDKSLLSRIGGPKTPTLGRGQLPGPLSRSASEASQGSQRDFARPAQQLKPLSMPDARNQTIDSPSNRWPNSAVSPRGFRSPLFEHRSVDSPASTRNNSMAEPFAEILNGRRSSHRGSVDQNVFLDPELIEEHGMRDLDISDRSPAMSEDFNLKGTKRRASSPPSDGARETRNHVPGPDNDLYNRRTAQVLAHRSPPSRYAPVHGSLASNSSAGIKNSFASTASFNMSIASSVTSHGGERLSPHAFSPITESEFHRGPVSPYPSANRTMVTNTRDSSTGASPQHDQQHEASDARTLPALKNLGGLARMQGFFVCECCPKKPKKFASREELDVHINEKQYQCLYCPNRFKNKNEAERHQNSLHLRRHSWSCAALSGNGGVNAAFHPSPTAPHIDICGYCGQEFANPADWDVRAEHLCQVHKFGECNQSKKFFRADHFRQHLKHSHAGTSGKWTNMLETACMKEEDPPIPLSQQRGRQAQALASQANNALRQMPQSNTNTSDSSQPASTTSGSQVPSPTSNINPELDNMHGRIMQSGGGAYMNLR